MENLFHHEDATKPAELAQGHYEKARLDKTDQLDSNGLRRAIG